MTLDFASLAEKAWPVLIAAGGFVLGFARLYSRGQKMQDDIAALKAEKAERHLVASIDERVDELSARLAAMLAEQARVGEELHAVTASIGGIEKSVAAVQSDVRKIVDAITKLTASIARVEGRLDGAGR